MPTRITGSWRCIEKFARRGATHAALVAANGLREDGVEPRRIVGVAQRISHRIGAQDARHTRQRLEVIGAGAHGGQQHHDDIDRLVIHGLVLDRRRQLHEHRHDALERGELAVRHGDAVAKSGGAQRLAIIEGLEDIGGRISR